MKFEEYIKIMKPYAHALDTLQGENEVTLGYVLPTIVILTRKLESITHLTTCTNIKLAVLRGSSKRFPMTDLERPQSKNFMLAAVSHPKFRMSWVDEVNFEMVRKIFMGAIDASTCDKSSEYNQTEDDFFFRFVWLHEFMAFR